MSKALLRALVRNNLISINKADEIVNEITFPDDDAKNQASEILSLIFRKKLISSYDLSKFISELYGFPEFDLSEYNHNMIIKDILTQAQINDYKVVPLFKRSNTIFLAVVNPTLYYEYRNLLFNTSYQIELVIVRYNQILDFLISTGISNNKLFEELEKNNEIVNIFPKVLYDVDISEEGPVAQFIHKTIMDAIYSKASDIHFEFYENFCRVRFRIDGLLKEMSRPPVYIKHKISSRIKVLCNLDISEKKVPQDGGMKLNIGYNNYINFRVSTLPTIFGEKIVIRILDNDSSSLDIDYLGLDDNAKKILLKSIKKTHGMILVTGPTGSGKTQTLYTCLNILNTSEVNISTAEDPVEINILGINQVSINEKQKLTFATALRAFLRQDPDIIMVGEIRDLETADIAIKAAQTGHLVFSTVHTNNAPATLTRMSNMGVALFNIASAVNLIIAQRLVRLLCDHCKDPMVRPSNDALKQMGFTDKDLDKEFTIYTPTGCRECKGRGYSGRTAIFEIMEISNNIQTAILNNKNEDEIRKIAFYEGMVDLRRSAIEKVINGKISLEELNAKTSDA